MSKPATIYRPLACSLCGSARVKPDALPRGSVGARIWIDCDDCERRSSLPLYEAGVDAPAIVYTVAPERLDEEAQS